MNPTETLAKGTLVRVKNQRGRVIDSRLVEAHNGGKVSLTTIKFTEQFKRGFGSTGVWEKMAKPITKAVNYSFIELA